MYLGYCEPFVDPKYIPKTVAELNYDDWKNEQNAKERFLSFDDFIKNLVIDLDSKLVGLQSFETSMKKTIADIFQPYLSKIFSFILYYLPYRDEIVNSLDFVTLSQDPQEIKNKILAFNNEFSIVPPNQISELTKEINQIFSNPNFQWTKITTKDSSS